MTSIGNIPEGLLRAWADHGVISSATYVHEMERRRGGHGTIERSTVEAPPLDYALDRDLSLPDCDIDLSELDDDPIGPMPPPPAVVWIIAVAAVAVVAIALWLVWP